MAERVVLGVDIGGTKVAAGMVDGEGNILSSLSVPMDTTRTASIAMDCVNLAIETAMLSAPGLQVSAIGVSSPGPLDPINGVVLNTPNLPCWKNFPLLEEIGKTYHLPARLDNDANSAGLAEALWGAATDYGYVFYVTIGTGIGTAIVQDRQIYYGRTGAAPEGGHMTIDYHATAKCGCGKRGCVEILASGPAIAVRARQKVSADGKRGAALMASALGDPAKITAENVVRAWKAGDAMAGEILEETSEILAIWMGNIIDLLEPEVIVIGGGVGARITELYEHIGERAQAWSINSRAHEIPMLAAKYGADSGIAGSAALWFREQRSASTVGK